jgi:hypothetical protein
MRPSDKLLSDLDKWTDRSASGPESRRLESLRALLADSLRGIPPDLIADIVERWAFLSRSPDDAKRARAWVDAACLLLMMDYNDDPPLSREDWGQIRELVSAEAENMDMDIVSYVMEQALDHGGF